MDHTAGHKSSYNCAQLVPLPTCHPKLVSKGWPSTWPSLCELDELHLSSSHARITQMSHLDVCTHLCTMLHVHTGPAVSTHAAN